MESIECVKLQGMGSILSDNGVTFRVWAPNANQVYVVGEFCDWEDEKHALEHEEDGYWSIHVNEAKSGHEYKYLIIYGDKKLYKNDPYSRKVTHSSGNSVVYDPYENWQDHEFKSVPFNQLVIYEMHIGTFNREGMDAGQVGTFYSAVDKFDYLKNLGINAIELMPIMEFSGDNSWGYNTSHPFAVESAYGGPEGLKHFIYEAHSKGLAVIIDVVYNHFGPTDLDLWQFDGWHEQEFGGIYFYNDDRAKTPWGENRPDYGRKEVRNYITDNALMCLDAYQCDGLRFDATAAIRYVDIENSNETTKLKEGYKFLQEINTVIRKKYPYKILIAEDLKEDAEVTLPIKENGLGFHSQWGLGFASNIKNALLELDDQHRNLQLVEHSLNFSFNNDAFQRVIFTESHDEIANGSNRFPEEIDPQNSSGEYAKKKSTLGAIILFTSPGIPMLFQGQEFLTIGSFSDSLPLDWSSQEENKGISLMYKDLILMRSGKDEKMIGLTGQITKTLHLNEENLVLAFSRTHQDFLDRPVLVILNFSHQAYRGYRIGIPFESDLGVRFNSGWKGYGEDFAENHFVETPVEGPYDGQKHSIKVDLPAFGGVILSRN